MFWGPQEKGRGQKVIQGNLKSDDDDNHYVKHFVGNKHKQSEVSATDKIKAKQHICVYLSLMNEVLSLIAGPQLEIGMPDHRLHSLLDLNPEIEEERRKFDGQAVIEEIRQKPYAARAKYTFKSCRHSCCPLQMAIILGASINVVDFLLSVYPRSIGARDRYGSTLLHSA
eukprot:9429124-Ditylum_brightwellii.AAC.1